MNTRKPAVSGTFYPGTKSEIEEEMENFFSSEEVGKVKPDRNAIGIVCPHAGYVYSGKTAAMGYARIREIGKGATFVILGPNHHGVGPEVSIYPEGEWETPLGKAKIDSDLVKRICGVCNGDLLLDASAHLYEHSIEVQVPFLQHLFGNDFKFLPICMLNQSMAVANEVSDILYETTKSYKKKVIFIASSDFSHYVPKKKAEQDDMLAIKRIEELDVKGFYETIGKKQISMCGYGPVATLMLLSRKMGSSKAELLRYSTSAEASGDEGAVVGYASIAFSKK